MTLSDMCHPSLRLLEQYATIIYCWEWIKPAPTVRIAFPNFTQLYLLPPVSHARPCASTLQTVVLYYSILPLLLFKRSTWQRWHLTQCLRLKILHFDRFFVLFCSFFWFIVLCFKYIIVFALPRKSYSLLQNIGRWWSNKIKATTFIGNSLFLLALVNPCVLRPTHSENSLLLFAGKSFLLFMQVADERGGR